MATEYVTHRDLDAFKTEMRGEFGLLRGESMIGVATLVLAAARFA